MNTDTIIYILIGVFILAYSGMWFGAISLFIEINKGFDNMENTNETERQT